jgi:hypothetical protein
MNTLEKAKEVLRESTGDKFWYLMETIFEEEKEDLVDDLRGLGREGFLYEAFDILNDDAEDGGKLADEIIEPITNEELEEWKNR